MSGWAQISEMVQETIDLQRAEADTLLDEAASAEDAWRERDLGWLYKQGYITKRLYNAARKEEA